MSKTIVWVIAGLIAAYLLFGKFFKGGIGSILPPAAPPRPATVGQAALDVGGTLATQAGGALIKQGSDWLGRLLDNQGGSANIDTMGNGTFFGDTSPGYSPANDFNSFAL